MFNPFKKIEIWILYLSLIISTILIIATAAMVRHGLIYDNPRYETLSKIATFLSRVPYSFRKIVTYNSDQNWVWDIPNNFDNISGFRGTSLEKESYLLLSRFNTEYNQFIVELIDLTNFKVINEWIPNFNEIRSKLKKTGKIFNEYKKQNNRFIIRHPILTEDGGIIFKDHSALIKIDKNSEIVWMNSEQIYHHSIEKDIDGGYWVPGDLFPFSVDTNYFGNDPNKYRDVSLTKVSPDGEILHYNSLTEILIKNNLDYLIFGRGEKILNENPIHLNDIQPVMSDGEYYKKGDLFLSLRHLSMILLYRPSSNKIIWKGSGPFYHQHDVNILDDHRISVFNNNSKAFYDGEKVDGSNEIIIYDFKTGVYSQYNKNTFIKHKIVSRTEGRGEILKNGNFFVEETNYGRTMFFSGNGDLIWEHINKDDSNKLSVVGWSRLYVNLREINMIDKIFN